MGTKIICVVLKTVPEGGKNTVSKTKYSWLLKLIDKAYAVCHQYVNGESFLLLPEFSECGTRH
jgi:hypothetical protein